MNISKFFCMLIAGLAIIGFTTIGHTAQEEGKQGEEITSEAAAEKEVAEEVESKSESSEEIQYGAEHELGLGEEEAKAEEKE